MRAYEDRPARPSADELLRKIRDEEYRRNRGGASPDAPGEAEYREQLYARPISQKEFDRLNVMLKEWQQRVAKEEVMRHETENGDILSEYRAGVADLKGLLARKGGVKYWNIPMPY